MLWNAPPGVAIQALGSLCCVTANKWRARSGSPSVRLCEGAAQQGVAHGEGVGLLGGEGRGGAQGPSALTHSRTLTLGCNVITEKGSSPPSVAAGHSIPTSHSTSRQPLWTSVVMQPPGNFIPMASGPHPGTC